MKNTIRIIFFITVLQSCTKKQINSDLIGEWISTKSSNIVTLEFHKDTLTIQQWKKETKNLWYSNDSKIFFSQLTEINPELETDFIIEYRLNSTKDTLSIKNSDSEFTNEFIKTNSQQN